MSTFTGNAGNVICYQSGPVILFQFISPLLKEPCNKVTSVSDHTLKSLVMFALLDARSLVVTGSRMMNWWEKSRKLAVFLSTRLQTNLNNSLVFFKFGLTIGLVLSTRLVQGGEQQPKFCQRLSAVAGAWPGLVMLIHRIWSQDFITKENKQN